jgi:hypothetical protein
MHDRFSQVLQSGRSACDGRRGDMRLLAADVGGATARENEKALSQHLPRHWYFSYRGIDLEARMLCVSALIRSSSSPLLFRLEPVRRSATMKSPQTICIATSRALFLEPFSLQEALPLPYGVGVSTWPHLYVC